MTLDASHPPLQQIGDYDLVCKLAEGGMGTVFKGRRRADGLIVAIKIIPASAARNSVLLQRFQREFAAASALDHPHIVKAIEYCDTVSTPFLVMEFVDGESLGQRLDREGRLSEAEAARIMTQVCQGLHRAHKMGLVHRDVKPDNVMLTRDGTAKLTDLGLVKDIEGEMNLTRTGRGLGTPHFMAPEQFRNAKNADARCDIYSLGATLYMMVTGTMPFDNLGPLDAWMKKSNDDYPAPRELMPTVSDQMDRAIRRAMSADPGRRPASCREFIEDVTGQSTRQPTQSGTAAATDLWYMVYRDDEGVTHTVKGTTENIRKAFREGLLGDAGNIRACRTKQGPFLPLRGYVEFRDMVMDPEEVALATHTPTPRPGTTDPPSQAQRQTVPQEPTVEYAGARPSGVRPRPADPLPPAAVSPRPGGKLHVEFEAPRPMARPPAPPVDWKFWGAVAVLAVATAIATFFLLPHVVQ